MEQKQGRNGNDRRNGSHIPHIWRAYFEILPFGGFSERLLCNTCADDAVGSFWVAFFFSH